MSKTYLDGLNEAIIACGEQKRMYLKSGNKSQAQGCQASANRIKRMICGSDCCQDDDCPCVKVCNDMEYCDKHFKEEEKEYSYLRNAHAAFVLNPERLTHEQKAITD